MTYEAHIVRSLILRKPIELEHIPETLIEHAKKNKVLYALGLYDSRIRKTEAWIELRKRRDEQIKSIIEVMELAESLGIRVLVVKTLKPFDYVPDDIDVLIIDDNALKTLVNALLNREYFIRKKGTPEITLRRITNNTFVDLDIHAKMGAGPYEYIDKYYLWNRRIYRKLNNIDVATPNDVDELLITIAHAVLKEFTITLADIMHIASLNKDTVNEAMLQSRYIGLSKSLKYILSLAYRTLALSLKIHKRHDISTLKYPHKIPIPVIISTYSENLEYRLKVHGLKPIKEMFKAPSSKGIATLLRYVGL
ncbi:MAG: hypothetical protein DRO40_04370 [Thermoprotei archaeon]|nr:MAG: hypothetical protein DRO40_04370 [Thermoprotei archaeon]